MGSNRFIITTDLQHWFFLVGITVESSAGWSLIYVAKFRQLLRRHQFAALLSFDFSCPSNVYTDGVSVPMLLRLLMMTSATSEIAEGLLLFKLPMVWDSSELGLSLTFWLISRYCNQIDVLQFMFELFLYSTGIFFFITIPSLGKVGSVVNFFDFSLQAAHLTLLQCRM